MALSSYIELQESIARWLHRDDDELLQSIPDLIALAESRINIDLRTRQMIVNATLTTISGGRAINLPEDCLELEGVGIVSSGRSVPLVLSSTEALDSQFPDGDGNRVPLKYAVLGNQLLLGPTPDAAYPVQVSYFAQVPRLDYDNTTNWLLQKHPGALLYGALAAAAPFIGSDDRIAIWEANYSREVTSIQAKSDDAIYSGSAMQIVMG